jgi:uncharacterized protein (DUF1810 family)
MLKNLSTRGSLPSCDVVRSKLTGCGSSSRSFPVSGIAPWPSALSLRDEAVAYLRHDVLGSRLRECTALVNAVEGRAIREILCSPDDLKFCSSMTLFGAVSSDPEFAAAISKFYGGKPD